jgi:hypothetical protein
MRTIVQNAAHEKNYYCVRYSNASVGVAKMRVHAVNRRLFVRRAKIVFLLQVL